MNSSEPKYRLLEELLRNRGLALQATYSTRDIANIFQVAPRAIQYRIAAGELVPRNLPGRGKFLPQDLEDFLVASRRCRSERFSGRPRRSDESLTDKEHQ